MLKRAMNAQGRGFVNRIIRQLVEYPEVRRFMDILMAEHWRTKAQRGSNPLLQRGQKIYSQNDEDGIINAILERIGINRGIFVEYGCGDGLENNTIQLLLRGWRGVWIGSQDVRITIPSTTQNLRFEKSWVTCDNCVEIMRRGIASINARWANVICIDLDGNDLFVVRTILESGYEPDLFVVEYNAKFPPPIRFAIEYDPAHVWVGSDYFGASLQSFVDLFSSFHFRLVCCNVTGTNAFFVAPRHTELFGDIPLHIEELFMPPDYNWFIGVGHKSDPRSIELFLRSK